MAENTKRLRHTAEQVDNAIDKVDTIYQNQITVEDIKDAIDSVPEGGSVSITIEGQKVVFEDDSDADVNIGDGNGNVVLQIKDGHIKTKNFDSSNIVVNPDTSPDTPPVTPSPDEGSSGSSDYADRPSSDGVDDFTVTVSYNNLKGTGNVNLSHRCLLALPTSYSKTGKPIKLIIACAGTGDQIENNTTIEKALGFTGWSAFLNAGYAVLDCQGISSGYASHVGYYNYGNSSEVYALHYGNPYLLQAYKKAYDYVVNKYNIAKDGCFVNGISLGGLSSFMLVQSGLFPVLAQVGMSPVTDIFKQAFLHDWKSPSALLSIPAYYNFDKRSEGVSDKDWFIRNIDKVKGYNSLVKNTFGDKTNLWNYFGDSGEPSEAEESVYNGLSKYYPCPLKIYHGDADTAVAYRYSKYMVKMIHNADGMAELVTIPNGNHNSGFSTSSINGAVEFFNRFKH